MANIISHDDVQVSLGGSGRTYADKQNEKNASHGYDKDKGKLNDIIFKLCTKQTKSD